MKPKLQWIENRNIINAIKTTKMNNATKYIKSVSIEKVYNTFKL